MDEEYEAYRASKAREYAEIIRTQRLKARSMMECLNDIRSAMDGISAMRYDSESVQSSGMEHGDDSVVRRVLEVDEAVQAYELEREEWMRMFGDFRERIAEVQMPYKDLLRLRYAHAFGWRTVANAIGYSEDHCRGWMNRRALSLLYDVMPIEYRDPRHQAI